MSENQNTQGKVTILLRALWTAFVVDIFVVGLLGTWIVFQVKVLGNDVQVGRSSSARR